MLLRDSSELIGPAGECFEDSWEKVRAADARAALKWKLLDRWELHCRVSEFLQRGSLGEFLTALELLCHSSPP
jgi:hypothetical protein